jgi:hypothetical protein
MDRFRFFQPSLLKTSFLFSLLVILFLLLSPVFQTPGNIPLANLIQSINSVLSRPLIMLENFTHLHMHWVTTALCILIFWFVAFYLILLLISSQASDKA